MKLNLIFMFLAIVGSITSYILAHKKHNKKILIITYISIFIFLITLLYLTLDLIIVGGIS